VSVRPFPFTAVPDTDAEMFIQWKGTDVCMDFHCPCGDHNHLDGYFAYYVRCVGCGAVYELGTQVKARRLPEGEKPRMDPMVDVVTTRGDMGTP
jgi:hypothetical protein